MKIQSILLLTTGLLLSLSCGSDQPSDAPLSAPATDTDTGTATASFVANPIKGEKREIVTLAIGAPAPDFQLPEADGGFVSLSDFAKAKILTVIFTCNHCPTAQAYEDRMIAYAKDYKSKNVAVVAISPNSPIGLLYEELGYTDLNDDYDQMSIRKKDKQFPFPYLYDGDNQQVSLAFGAVATPHVFLFDESRKLQYAGRMDSSEKPGTANAEDLRAATDALLAGEPVATPSTKTFGCSTKWSWKDEYRQKVDKEWKETPVSIEEIDEAGIAALLKNDSEKLRLINVWATWCGPCILEYPDLVATHRMFKGRDFEFISISADKLDKKEKARKKLQEMESALSNYIFSGKDNYALAEAIDPDWNAALPYTILVEPGGKVIYKHQGALEDVIALRKIIVEHPMIGRYF
ncbi:MAG: redoxin domain-containing protein [Bacteroidota bacterium]